MKPADEKKVRTLLQEIRHISRDLPSGKSRKVTNRCDKIALIIKKSNP